jgi:hypothetical protein
MNTVGIPVVKLFSSYINFLKHILFFKFALQKLAKNLFMSISGSVSGRFQKSDSDLVKIVRIRNTALTHPSLSYKMKAPPEDHG